VPVVIWSHKVGISSEVTLTEVVAFVIAAVPLALFFFLGPRLFISVLRS
jgi:hypothetical protein